MKAMIHSSAIALLVVWSSVALAQNPAGEPLESLLISPDVLIQHREQLGLSDEQIEQIRARVEQAGTATQEHEAKLKDSMGRLAELLSAERVDEEAALDLLDQVLAAEKQLKHLHMRLLIQIRNQLTAQQRRTASGLRQAAETGPEIEQRLKAKISLIEREVQSRAQAGQPPFEAVGFMQKLPMLMQKGQVREAEALLDRVLQMLGLQPGNLAAEPQPSAPAATLAGKIQQIQRLAQQKQQRGEDVSAIGKLMEKIGPLMQQGKQGEAEALLDQVLGQLGGENARPDGQPQPAQPKADPASPDPDDAGDAPSGAAQLSPDQLEEQVAGLQEEKVAWREIPWKTCLIDGLNASRQQHKPVMLWIFIDRPIDDERC